MSVKNALGIDHVPTHMVAQPGGLAFLGGSLLGLGLMSRGREAA